MYDETIWSHMVSLYEAKMDSFGSHCDDMILKGGIIFLLTYSIIIMT